MSRERGNRHEDRVCAWLEAQKIKLIARNFYCRGGEIDVIASEARCIAFIEIRKRKSQTTAIESVDSHKQRKLIHAARHFIANNPTLSQRQFRFDVIGVDDSSNPPLWLKNAFEIDSL